MRAVARRWGCSVRTVWRWVHRAEGYRLDRVDWSDRPRGRSVPVNRTSRALEQRVVQLRRWLARHDALGYVGPAAIRQALLATQAASPSARTIARILNRAGITPQKRHRHPPPPVGWYLPSVADGRTELDQLDVVEGLHLRHTGPIEALTGISLWGKLSLAAVASHGWRIDTIRPVLLAHWAQWGAPTYLQMDNDTRFAGSSRATRRLGRFICFCLQQGVIPVFVPPRETGFQAAVENFNGLWQTKVWQRRVYRNLVHLRRHNQAFRQAHQARARDQGPARNPAPRSPVDRVIFLRRTDAQGRIRLLDACIPIDADWPHRPVRAELNVSAQTLRVYALRRRDPKHQPLLKVTRFHLR